MIEIPRRGNPKKLHVGGGTQGLGRNMSSPEEDGKRKVHMLWKTPEGVEGH